MGEQGAENQPGTLGSQGWERGVWWGKKERMAEGKEESPQGWLCDRGMLWE